MVSLSVMDADGSRPERSRSSRKVCSGSQRCARDFEQNLRRLWQGAADRHQCTSRADVQSGRKLKEFFAFFITAANKNRDR